MSYSLDDQDDQNQDPSQVDKATQPTGAPPADNESDDQAAQQPSISSGGGTGVVSAGGGNVGGGASTPSVAAKPSSSGSWTNLQDYLNTNSDQAGKLGSDIAGSVNSQASTAQNDIGNLNSSFGNAVAANTVNSDPSAVNSAISTANTTGNLTASQIAAFQNQSQASYNGPSDITADPSYGTTVGDVNKANTAVAQTQSEAGRNSLLQNQYKNSSSNGYNQGENNLDQMLLENSPGAQQQLQPLSNNWAGLTSALDNTVNSNQSAAAAAKATDQATAANAQKAVNSSLSNFTTGLNNQVSTDQSKNQAAYNDYQSNVSGGNYKFDPATLAALGLTSGTRTFNLDLNNYLNPYSSAAYNDQTVATPEQYAQYNALNQLAGTTGTLLPNNALAGTAPANAGFNTTQLQSDVAAKQNAYATAYANQRSGILNTNYLSQGGLNGNSSGGYADSIPGALTQRRDINTASPQELQSFWLPLFQQASAMYGLPMYSVAANGIQQSLAKWQNDQGYNNVITSAP